MLSNLDQIIFPLECEVLEIVPHVQYVYPIFKNGSSSLRASNFRSLSSSEIKNLKTVDVFVRDPWERFLSGINTYLSNLDHDLDKPTAMYFVKNYLFLNRHYIPQIFWLINLRRFSTTRLNIRPLNELNTITALKENSTVINPMIKEYFQYTGKLRFYLEMDEVLSINLIGKTVEFDEIIAVLRSNYGELYREVFQYSMDILNVVR